MDFDSVVKSRRSIRAFKREAVPKADLVELIDLARHAPSSMNGQPWHFVLVGSDEKKAQLVDIKNRFCPPSKQDYRADFLAAAAWVVVICVDRARAQSRGIESAVAATTILLLAAQERGLGSVFMTAYNPDDAGLAREIRKLLHIPDGIDPVTLLPIGRPAETPSPKYLTPLEPMIHVDTF